MHSNLLILTQLPGDYRAAGAAGFFFFLSVMMISLFSFISVVVWTQARRKEREAYYKAETMRRIAESSGDGAKYIVEVMREEERIRQERERQRLIKSLNGLKIGGMVNIGIAIALSGFLYAVTGGAPVYYVGLFPALIGVALLIYVYLFAPKTGQF